MEPKKERLKRIMTAGTAVVYSCKIEGEKFLPTFASENFKELWGYEPEEIIGNPEWWVSNLHPDERESVLAGVGSILKTGCHTHEYRFRHKDGNYRWVYDRLRLVRDESDRPVEIVGSWLDITEFKGEGGASSG
ncbi:MAG: PAS domain-containing protein [Thermodesulfobacteriota bacterium]